MSDGHLLGTDIFEVSPGINLSDREAYHSSTLKMKVKSECNSTFTAPDVFTVQEKLCTLYVGT